MSIPFLTFTCDACDYHSSSFVNFGEFLWNFNGQTFRFDRQIGLCQDCEEIVAMEYLPTMEEFERARELNPELAGKFINFFKEEYVRILASREGFNVLQRVMELQRPPVCLKCGGSDVEPLVLPEVSGGAKLTDIQLTDLGVKHPGCKGHLMVEGSGSLRMGVNPVTHYFDIYGRALASLQKTQGLVSEPPPPRETKNSYDRSQVWRPDWVVFDKQSKAIEITFDNPELDIVLSKVDVVEETDGCFRIYSYAFSDVLYWGDLFEGEVREQDSIRFIRLLDRPKYFHFLGYRPPMYIPIPRTRQKWCERLPYLQRVINVGGFWEYNALLGQYVAIPEECLKDFPEFESRIPLPLEKSPSDILETQKPPLEQDENTK